MNNATQTSNPTLLGRHQSWNGHPASAIQKIIRKTSRIFSSKRKTQSTIQEETRNSNRMWESSTNTFSRYSSGSQTPSYQQEEPFKQQVMTCIVPITLLSFLANLPQYQLVSVSPPLKVHTVVSHVVVHTPPKVSCQQTESLIQTTLESSRSPCTTYLPNHTSSNAEIELLNLYLNETLPRK